jgi:phosphohistidine phosphatase
LRAQETAQILSDTFGVPFKSEPALGYEFSASSLLKNIPSAPQPLTIFLVGHAPTLANFVNDLIGESALRGLCKSGAAVINFPNNIEFGKGKLFHYYRP